MFAEAKFETKCIVCDASVPLADYETYGVYIKVCEDCKKAIRFAKAMMEHNKPIEGIVYTDKDTE